MLLGDIIQAIRARQSTNPRTLLAFYGSVLAIVIIGAVGAVTALAETHTMTYLIPWILVFAGVVIVALLVGVFVLTIVDPSSLMLGQVTASDYVAIHRLRLGDSDMGERESTLVLPSEMPSVPKLVSPAATEGTE
jgi:hypothetical protein